MLFMMNECTRHCRPALAATLYNQHHHCVYTRVRLLYACICLSLWSSYRLAQVVSVDHLVAEAVEGAAGGPLEQVARRGVEGRHATCSSVQNSAFKTLVRIMVSTPIHFFFYGKRESLM